ncbi:DUF424 family protein [Candidatus Pacearchaeota archaeon]|nr:MAG: DUF424 family protein [Candidatus Pacearchaeota archaeon]
MSLQAHPKNGKNLLISSRCRGMYVKIHESYRNVVAICDAELVGKYFDEGKMQLEVKENFFVGERKSEDEVKRVMLVEKGKDSTFNIVGERAVKLALEAGIITEDNVGRVAGVPFALVLL